MKRSVVDNFSDHMPRRCTFRGYPWYLANFRRQTPKNLPKWPGI